MKISGKLASLLAAGFGIISAVTMCFPTWQAPFLQPEGGDFVRSVPWVSPTLVGYGQYFPILSFLALLGGLLLLGLGVLRRKAPLLAPVLYAASALLATLGFAWLPGPSALGWLAVFLTAGGAVLLFLSRWLGLRADRLGGRM